MSRIAIINPDKCRPKKCQKECMKKCPVNRTGKKCLTLTDIEDIKIAHVAENLCIGCSQCVKACPFNAIDIVNLPKELDPSCIIHQYGENMFRVYNMPRPDRGVIGIMGENGIGKSTMLRIISGDIIPNMGHDVASTGRVLASLKGDSVQKYYSALYRKKIKVVTKEQNISSFASDKLVHDVLSEYSVSNDVLSLKHLYDSKLSVLSGGELQRVYCAYVLSQDADLYIIDEPTNYLDVSQRMAVGRMIQSLQDKMIIVVDHDVTFLDYVADRISIMYGVPGAYGIVTLAHNTSNAINNYFDGYLSTENIRFRPEKFRYDISVEVTDDAEINDNMIEYNGMNISYDNVSLYAPPGRVHMNGAINVVLGKNGTGKSSFIKTLAEDTGMRVSQKPQYPSLDKILNKSPNMTVRQLLHHTQINDDTFRTDVVNVMGMKNIYDKEIRNLSGGELQRLVIVYCLGQKADIYLIDEPSANLDIHQRINAIRAIKRHVINRHKTAFIVEHDITMAFVLANNMGGRVIVFGEECKDKRYCSASTPLSLNDGMEMFLRDLDVTFRRTHNKKRYRINKQDSCKDREQKESGNYFIS